MSVVCQLVTVGIDSSSVTNKPNLHASVQEKKKKLNPKNLWRYEVGRERRRKVTIAHQRQKSQLSRDSARDSVRFFRNTRTGSVLLPGVDADRFQLFFCFI